MDSSSNCSKSDIAHSLVESYHKVGGINRLDSTNLPSRSTVGALCSEFLRLLFPGFFESESLHSCNLHAFTEERITELSAQMIREITKSRSAQDAHEITCDCLMHLPQVRELLQTDVEAAYEGDPAATSYEVIILSYPAIEAIAIQRVAHLLFQKEVPLIPRMMTEWAHSRTGIDIHPGAAIGSHFFIDHGTGVVIGETCSIGNHVKLYHGVTLGARSFPKDADGHIVKGNKRHPNVGDYVTIYPNATILGGKTTIGEGCTIGANVFLRTSIPADTLVTTEGAALRFLDKSTGQELELAGEQILPASLP